MFHFSSPFSQIRKKRQSIFGNQGNNFGGFQQNNNGWGNIGGSNNGWGQQSNNNNNGWGNQGGSNNGWGNISQNNNNWGNQGGSNNNNNGWGNYGSNNGWSNQSNNQGGNQGQGNGGCIFQNINFQNFVQQQIVLIQPSPHQEQIQQLKKNKGIFKDNRFVANVNSLSGQWGNLPQWKSITWTPISTGIPGAKIIEGKIQPNDIKQGYLGDCYFLAALAALAEKQQRIQNLFLQNTINEQRYYSVKILFKGKWMRIDMDQYVPFLYNEPAFSKSVNKQLWVILLQKAWAKLYSNYKRIEAGYPQQGLHDLTGAPIKNIYMQQASFNKQAQWEYLLNKASKYDYAMVASSQPGSDTTKSFSGIVQGHAYTFLNAAIINFKGQQVRIVQLRNPWGKGQFNGAWSDKDPNWSYIDQNQKKRINLKLCGKDDGVFYMSYDQFCKQFRALTIAQINQNASYVYKSFKDRQNKGCYFKVKIMSKQQVKYSFQVDKTPQRSYPDKVQEAFQYPSAEIQVGKLNGNIIEKYPGAISSRRTLYHPLKLTAGEYIVYVKINHDSRFQQGFDVNLAVYSEFACQIDLASAKQADMFAGRDVQWVGKDSNVQCQWNNLKSYSVNPYFNQLNNQMGNQQNNLGGWGNQQPNNNWSNQQQGGWGNQQKNNNWGNQQGGSNNDGWGNQPQNNGWGGQSQNNGWGNQPSNNGWGNQPSNNGWGNQSQNNGWGNQNNNNNGW